MRQTFLVPSVPLLVLAIVSGGAQAHAGEHHEGLLATLMHLATEPDHLAMAVVAVMVGGVGARLARRHRDAPKRNERDDPR